LSSPSLLAAARHFSHGSIVTCGICRLRDFLVSPFEQIPAPQPAQKISKSTSAVVVTSIPVKVGIDLFVWPNQSPEPTAVGAVSSAIAVHVASRRWLSFFR